MDTRRAVEAGVMRRGNLIDRGLPTVISQTFRTLIHSRLEVGLARYEDTYDGADVVLLEPRRDDYRMFFTNIFSFSSRRWVCEHAYQATRRELYARREELAPLFEKLGITFRVDVLEEDRDLWSEVGLPEAGVEVATRPEWENGGQPPSGSRRSAGPIDPAQTLAELDAVLDRLENHVLEVN